MNRRDAFDRLTHLAATMFDAPIALITVLDDERQWFRSNRGLSGRETELRESFCAHAIGLGEGAVMAVPDATLDPRFIDNRLVREEGIRFYAGGVITTSSGRAEGAVCVLDHRPRPPLTPAQEDSLRLLARLAAAEIEQIQAEAIRAEQLETLRLAESMAGVGHWRLDVAGGAVFWSDEVYRIHGLEPGSVDPTYHSALGAYHPDDKARIDELVKRALATGEGYDVGLRIYRADGEERTTRAKAQCQRDEAGRVTALFGVFQDVTDRERTVARIERSEAQYRLLADNLGDVVARIQPGGRSNYISPAIESLLGYTAADMAGRTAQSFVHPDDQAAVVAVIFRGMGGERSQRIQHRAVHKDGRDVWVESHFQAVMDDGGGVSELVVTIRDVSARKALEDELIEARDRAEAAARAKSDFLSNMSHELRTPLTSVVGFAGLLKASEVLPEAERRYADRIGTASEALLSVINDILDYSKLDADAVDLDPMPFEPRAMAEGAASIVEGQCRAKGLDLRVEVDAGVPAALMGDEGRLRQVTLNFLSNAAKFTGAGAITLRLTQTAGRLRLEVIDTGIGVAPDKIAQLFDRFTQADASTTRVYGGTGLGLAISRRLIEMMGGEIGADSRPSEGSTFWFEVPLAVAEMGARPAPATATTGPSGLKVLMADDAAANRELVRAMLSGLDLELDTVEDGAQAVEAACARAYDLILMDVHMPVMDGLAATTAIRALPEPAARIPIVALTANVQPEQVERCLAAGMNGHVGKPIQLPELLGVMGACLDATREDVPAAA